MVNVIENGKTDSGIPLYRDEQGEVYISLDALATAGIMDARFQLEDGDMDSLVFARVDGKALPGFYVSQEFISGKFSTRLAVMQSELAAIADVMVSLNGEQQAQEMLAQIEEFSTEGQAILPVETVTVVPMAAGLSGRPTGWSISFNSDHGLVKTVGRTIGEAILSTARLYGGLCIASENRSKRRKKSKSNA